MLFAEIGSYAHITKILKVSVPVRSQVLWPTYCYLPEQIFFQNSVYFLITVIFVTFSIIIMLYKISYTLAAQLYGLCRHAHTFICPIYYSVLYSCLYALHCLRNLQRFPTLLVPPHATFLCLLVQLSGGSCQLAYFLVLLVYKSIKVKYFLIQFLSILVVHVLFLSMQWVLGFYSCTFQKVYNTSIQYNSVYSVSTRGWVIYSILEQLEYHPWNLLTRLFLLVFYRHTICS